MSKRLTGVLAGLVLAVPAVAVATPPTQNGRSQDVSSPRELSASGGAEAVNTSLRSDAERKFQRDVRVKARSQVVGTVVDMRSKVMYVRVDSGVVIPVDGRALSFKRGLDEGDVIRVTFIVDDELTNLAMRVEKAVPVSAGG